MSKKVNILVGDDCKIFCMGLRQSFIKSNLCSRMMEANGAEELIIAMNSLKPQIMLLNIGLHVNCKKVLSDALKKMALPVKIIALYDSSQERSVQATFNDQLHGFVHKNSSQNEFINAVERVMNNGIFYCFETQKILSSYLSAPKIIDTTFPDTVYFTDREKQIIRLICKEYTAKEIATKLLLSKRTVENRKIRILKKINAKNIAGIVGYAYKNKLVSLVD